MTAYLITSILLIVAYLFSKRQTQIEKQDYRTAFLSQYAGIFPVFPDGPNDALVEERAAQWRERFEAHQNKKAVVIAYPFNTILDGTTTTITKDYQDSMVLFCQNYLRKVEELHLLAALANQQLSQRHFGGQQ